MRHFRRTLDSCSVHGALPHVPAGRVVTRVSVNLCWRLSVSGTRTALWEGRFQGVSGEVSRTHLAWEKPKEHPCCSRGN